MAVKQWEYKVVRLEEEEVERRSNQQRHCIRGKRELHDDLLGEVAMSHYMQRIKKARCLGELIITNTFIYLCFPLPPQNISSIMPPCS